MSESRTDLREAIAYLRREFPGEGLYEARLEYVLGERDECELTERYKVEKQWTRASWRIQVGNDSATADWLSDAVDRLYERRAQKEMVPALAERVAAILREVPVEGFARREVIDAAERLIERERGSQ